MAFGIIDFCVCFPGRNGSLEKWQLPAHTHTHTEKPCEWWECGSTDRTMLELSFSRRKMFPSHTVTDNDSFHIALNDSNFTLISFAFYLPNWQNSISANTFSMHTHTHPRTYIRTHTFTRGHAETHTTRTHIHTDEWILKRYANEETHSRRIAGLVSLYAVRTFSFSGFFKAF